MLKYQAHIDKHGLSDCPPSDLKGRNITAYRFVFSPIDNKDNFKPQSVKAEEANPPRLLKLKNEAEACKSYCALSMFEEKVKAELFWKSVPFRFKLGSHIAEGSITDEMGLCSSCDENTHFAMFEFELVNLVNSFAIIGQLVL